MRPTSEADGSDVLDRPCNAVLELALQRHRRHQPGGHAVTGLLREQQLEKRGQERDKGNEREERPV